MNYIIDYMNNILEQKTTKINNDNTSEDTLVEKNKIINTLEINYKLLKDEYINEKNKLNKEVKNNEDILKKIKKFTRLRCFK